MVLVCCERQDDHIEGGDGDEHGEEEHEEGQPSAARHHWFLRDVTDFAIDGDTVGHVPFFPGVLNPLVLQAAADLFMQSHRTNTFKLCAPHTTPASPPLRAL